MPNVDLICKSVLLTRGKMAEDKGGGFRGTEISLKVQLDLNGSKCSVNSTISCDGASD